MTTAGLQLGAPGVYRARERPEPLLRPVRLDVAGFVGVASMGPVNTPTLVRSWSDYQLRFGGFERPGLLPYAVSVFFEQGGERAYVVRVGPPGAEPNAATDPARALFELALQSGDDSLRFVAANPGSWGNRLGVRLQFDATPQFALAPPPSTTDTTSAKEILLPGGLGVPRGSLLRVRGPGMPRLGGFRWVDGLLHREIRRGRPLEIAVLDQPVPWPEQGTGPLVADVVTATLTVEDSDPRFPRSERLTGLGLDWQHPDYLPDVVLRDSLLVRPVGDGAKQRIRPSGPALGRVVGDRIRDGRDVDELIDGSCFFDQRTHVDLDEDLDPDPVIATPRENPDRLRGATGLARIKEIGLLAVPDLFWRWLEQKPPLDVDPVLRSAGFQPCPPDPGTTAYEPSAEAVLLDASTPGELEEIVARQQALVVLADDSCRFVALLDVPQRLDVRGIAAWRARFDSSYAAAYHPWLGVMRSAEPAGSPARQGARAPVRTSVPPSAFAAGIVAARELRLGLPWGPANELAVGAVVASASVPAAEHDLLHPLGINVFQPERDGFRLTGARTLSRNPDLRQLSVRRLMTMLRLALDRQMQWVVFEPSTPALRELLRHALLNFLRGLYRGGAFVGASEEEAFFVRVDDSLNPPSSTDLGRLVIEVGVAPAQPVEFIVLRISRDGDGGVRVEETADD
jgi:hypothetical protein